METKDMWIMWLSIVIFLVCIVVCVVIVIIILGINLEREEMLKNFKNL